MTKLAKRIKREFTIPRVNRPVIVEIDPERRAIGFHEKGCRRTYYLHLLTAFEMAIRADRREAHEND